MHVRRLRGVVVAGYPHHLKVPGGVVAVVTKGGVIALRYAVAAILARRRVQLPGGQQRSGYLIKAKPGSIRQPTAQEKNRLGIRWYDIGQFRYFTARTGKAIVLRPQDVGNGDYIEDDPPTPGTDSFRANRKVSFRDFYGSIPGYPRDHPEAKLVSRYVKWLNDPGGFGHNYIREAGLFVDLFDRRKWRLLEAKFTSERERVRTAVGQLLDYRRFYNRHPSVGVLLPGRPSAACLGYLKANRIVGVWETPNGRFNDSSEERSWTVRRKR
jgi:hypothetical protein